MYIVKAHIGQLTVQYSLSYCKEMQQADIILAVIHMNGWQMNCELPRAAN